MPRNKHNKEQQQKAAQHTFGRRARIIAVNQNDQHHGKDDGTRKDEPRPLLILRTLKYNRILPHIFIEQFLQSETPSHFTIICIIAQIDSRI